MEDPKEEEEWADGPELEGGLPTTGPQTDTEPDLQNFKAVAQFTFVFTPHSVRIYGAIEVMPGCLTGAQQNNNFFCTTLYVTGTPNQHWIVKPCFCLWQWKNRFDLYS